jgi:hypothetical protein
MEREAQSLEHQGRDLIGCITVLRDKNATDVRDFIYGLRAIISTREADMLILNYELSYHEIYAKETFASIVSWKNYNVLAFMRLGKTISTWPSETSMPSWAVDFADQKDHANFRGCGWSIGH